MRTIKRLKGAFALCLMFKDDDKRLYVTKRSAPLVIGYGKSDIYVGSDAVSLSNLINKVIFLDEDDVAVISKKETEIFNKTGKKIERKKKSVELNSEAINKGNYQHFMIKEIFEQPEVFTYATSSFINFKQQKIEMLNEFNEFDNIDKIIFVACGTAFYACAVAKYWFEKYVKVPVEIDAEEAQKRIRETLAKLQGGGKKKSVKNRREKRQAHREIADQETQERTEESKMIKIAEFATANELSTMMDVPVTEIISSLMSLGLMVTMNQRFCLLYTSPSPRDQRGSRMPSSA